MKRVSFFSLLGVLTHLIVLSLDPETTNLPRYCKQAIPLRCPERVRTNSRLSADQTFIVRSPDALTIYLSSKSTTFTAALKGIFSFFAILVSIYLWPTRTRRMLISLDETMSQTAMERSFELKNKQK